MDDEKLDPYYGRKSKKDSQAVLFWVCIGIAAILCLAMLGYVGNRLETFWAPIWAR